MSVRAVRGPQGLAGKDLDLDDNRQSPVDITAMNWMCTIYMDTVTLARRSDGF